MAKHLYLPQLDTDANISIPSNSGHWERKDRGIIQAIADGISISEAEESGGVSSVPDVWARPIMFQSAIKPVAKNPHPLRKRVLQEWRGMLSLLALANIKNYSISIVPVELNSDTFSIALRNLAPAPVQLEKDVSYQWSEIFLIYLDQLPLGAFSPTTLVYTASDYRENLLQKDIPLKDGYGYLAPPTETEDLKAVGEWLCVTRKKLQDITDKSDSNKDLPTIEMILNLMDEWLDELRKKFSIQSKMEIEAENVRVSEDVIDTIEERVRTRIKNLKVYHSLLTPLEKMIEGELQYHSAMSLEMEKGRNRTPFNEVVIITKNLLQKNLKIWDTWRLNDLGGDADTCLSKYFDGETGAKIDRVDLEKNKAIWIRPEKYFLTNRLLCSKIGNMLTEGEADFNFSRKFILPFKKEILDFYSPEQIKDILKPAYKEEVDGVKFSFMLPIVGGITEKVEKFYKTKEISVTESSVVEIEPPMIELFPKYMDKNWRRYYIFNDRADDYKIIPLVDHKAPIIVERSHNLAAGNEMHKIQITEITSDNAFPEAFEILDNKASNGISGLILLSKPFEPDDLSTKWVVGIDLGTSNTNIFKQSSSSEMAEQWTFNFKKYFRPITTINNEHRNKLLEFGFIPDKEIELPIPTMLRIFDSARKTNLLADYFIHFPLNYSPPRNVYSDIKWEEEEKKTKYFIESILFLVFLEAVDRRVHEIVLACSYPKVFSLDNRNVFEGEWRQVLRKLIHDPETSILNVHQAAKDVGKLKISNEPYFEIEGQAAGEFFASDRTIELLKDRANTSIAAICLDVGGGTTDISIWFEEEIIADASVLLAGRQIAQLFQKNAQSRELLFSKAATIALEEKLNEPTYFAARLNYILKKEERQIRQLLLDLANKSELLWLRKMLTLEFCALSYYTAILTIASDKFLNKNILARIKEAGIKLHWGGNAAKFLNWINFGKYEKDSIISKMLNAVYFQALYEAETQAKSLNQLQSPGHKREVSGGLVVMKLGKREDDSASEGTSEYLMGDNAPENKILGIVAGENIVLENTTVDYLSQITGNDLFHENAKTKFKSTSMDKLKSFLEIFNFFGLKFGLFSEDGKVKLTESNERLIQDSVLSNFVKAQSMSESQRIIEPIFILEIRTLLEILRDEMR